MRKTEGKRRVNSSVAKSFGHDRDLPLRLLWSSSLLQEDIEEREREREQELEGQSEPLVCKKLCSRAVLVLSDYVYNL